MKNDFTAIIVDDEPSSSEMLTDCLGYLFPNIKVLHVFDTWKAALPVLRDEEYDLLFMDISMPGKTGIEMLEILPGRNFEVIFITAHSEHALTVFKFAPSGYVLKPVDDNKLSVAVNNALERVNYKRLARIPKQGSEIKIGIPDKKGTEYINIGDIIYLEAMNGCTKVVTKGGEITSSYTLGKFVTVLESNGFLQVHRSFIINTRFIKRYTIEGNITLANGASIPVSKNFKDELLAIFNTISRSEQ